MAAILKDLFEHHLIFVGGKGGVGKTTIASAIGLAAAKRGHSCLLVSTDPAHSLGDIFDMKIGESQTKLTENLWGLEIDPDAESTRHITSVKTQMKQLHHKVLLTKHQKYLNK